MTRGRRARDAQILGPATTLTVEYTEDNPGDWLSHCHVTDHMARGMVGRSVMSDQSGARCFRSCLAMPLTPVQNKVRLT